jgi:hypothetical protein
VSAIVHRAEALRDALRDAAEVMYLERTLSADNANSVALRMAEDRFAFSCRDYAEAIDGQDMAKQPKNWTRRRAS